MSMSKNVRFGIIGAGMISHFHAKAVADAEGAELGGVFSPREESRKEFVSRHGGRAYGTLRELLADPAIDAVAIATPTGLHRDSAIPAAKAGKHVLCEKPLETTPERAQEIIDACRENNVMLAPVFQYRFSLAAMLVKKAVEQGRFGKILMANARIKWFRPQSYYDSGAWRGTRELDGGGCLMNQSIHAIDLLLHLAGTPSEVYGHAMTAAHKRIDVEDTAAAVIRFANGAVGVIESATSLAPGWPLEVEVSGTRGTARITAESLTVWDFADGDPLDEKAAALKTANAASSGASDPAAINTDGHRKIIEDLVKSIRGGAKAVIDGEEAKLPIELICGIYESVKTKMPFAGFSGARDL